MGVVLKTGNDRGTFVRQNHEKRKFTRNIAFTRGVTCEEPATLFGRGPERSYH